MGVPADDVAVFFICLTLEHFEHFHFLMFIGRIFLNSTSKVPHMHIMQFILASCIRTFYQFLRC